MESREPAAFTEPKLLLGEGHEEKLVFGALIEHLGLSSIDVRQYRGTGNLGSFLKAATQVRGFSDLRSIGITRDSDDSPASALQSVQSALRAANLPVPSECLTRSTDKPYVTVFLAPDSLTSGMLEDLLLRSVQNDPAGACVDAFMECVRRAVPTPPSNEAKARAHAFLASRTTPDLRVGEAAVKGVWDFDSPALAGLRTFISSL